MKRIFILTLLGFCFSTGLFAQKVIDGVIAVVGNEPVLRSDIEVQMHQIKDLKPEDMDKARCFILDQLMQKKLLLTKAKLDSLKVTDVQVEGELDRRIQYFVTQFGSEEKFESYYNKTIPEFKEEFREPVREQLLTEQMQNKIIGNVNVTPEEVKKFYNEIPEDSLPYYNTEMEIGQIVIYPKINKEEKNKEFENLKGIRDRIVGGSSFSTLAILYSEDPGSAAKGGDLGWQKVSNFVPEFASACLSLKKDSISGIIETKYGYHIIQLLERRGDLVHVRHILRKPKVSPDDYEKAKIRLDSILTYIRSDSMNFTAAAYKFSQDEETRNRGGIMIDTKTSASRIPVDELDANVFFVVDKLKPGEVSDPVAFTDQEGKQAYRILFLKSKTLPHKANLKDDYPKIKDMAEQYKKSQELDKWVTNNIPKIYAHINTSYVSECDILDKWKDARNINISKQ